MIPTLDRYLDDPNILFVDPAKLNDSSITGNDIVHDTVNAINQHIGGMGDSLQELLEYVFVSTKKLFPCNRLGLAFLSDDNERVTAFTAVADFEPILLKQGYSEDLRGSSLEYILHTEKTRIIHDLEKYLDRHPDSRSTSLLIKEGIRSSLTCPLKVESRIVGLFFRSSMVPGSYNEEHIAIHLAIADRLSQAVEKSYRIDKLSEAMQHNTEMIGFVSHEIKSPIATTIMESKMILDNYFGEMDPRIRTRIERTVARSESLLAMVRDFLDLSRLESRELTLETVRDVDLLTDVIEPVVDILNTTAKQKNMEIHINAGEGYRSVAGNPDMLRIAVTNLVSNAIKYGNEQTVIRIDVENRADRIQLSVMNEGPGFPRDQIPNLFRKFSRLQTPALIRRKGTGLGLYITWKIIKLHQGRVSAESDEGSWAKFTIDLPEKTPV